MVYGINFNGTAIPKEIAKRFRKRLRTPSGEMADLKGVGQSASERDAMLVQAINGSRKMHVEERKAAAGMLYGLYASGRR